MSLYEQTVDKKITNEDILAAVDVAIVQHGGEDASTLPRDRG
jgi:hypothetical protein